MCGLTEATSGAHILRASLESIGYQIRDVFDAMQQDIGSPLKELWVDGGATRNSWLMQFLANLCCNARWCVACHRKSRRWARRIWPGGRWAVG